MSQLKGTSVLQGREDVSRQIATSSCLCGGIDQEGTDKCKTNSNRIPRGSFSPSGPQRWCFASRFGQACSISRQFGCNARSHPKTAHTRLEASRRRRLCFAALLLGACN